MSFIKIKVCPLMDFSFFVEVDLIVSSVYVSLTRPHVNTIMRPVGKGTAGLVPQRIPASNYQSLLTIDSMEHNHFYSLPNTLNKCLHCLHLIKHYMCDSYCSSSYRMFYK